MKHLPIGRLFVCSGLIGSASLLSFSCLAAERRLSPNQYVANVTVTVGEILSNPWFFANRHVRVMGLASERDGNGRWLYLEGEEERIYVETPFEVGSISGQAVIVSAIVHVSQSAPKLIAKSVVKAPEPGQAGAGTTH